MITITNYQKEETQQAAQHSQEITPTTALYHCEKCHAWWGKDVQHTNPLARYVLFLTYNFNWKHYHGWHTGHGIDKTCVVCGQATPQMFTAFA
jgi:hypothetical protein